MNKTFSRNIFGLMAILGGIVVIYHIVGIFYRINSSPVWRHILFILISLICIYGMLKRPRWFVWFFFFLLLQQLYSHGSDIVLRWKNEHHLDWISVAVLVIMPLAFALLIYDRVKYGRGEDS